MGEFPINIKNKSERKSRVLWVALCVLVIFLVMHLAFNVTYTKIYVVGTSMQSTLTGAEQYNKSGGDYVYVSKYITPRRGDIVVIDVGNRYLIKRVIALGGDFVELKNGVLYLNGVQTEEPYVEPENNDPNKNVNTFAEIKVDEGCVFCMGDNRNVSNDSRGAYGCMQLSSVVGVVAEWSLQFKSAVTKYNTFFDFTVPALFKA